MQSGDLALTLVAEEATSPLWASGNKGLEVMIPLSPTGMRVDLNLKKA